MAWRLIGSPLSSAGKSFGEILPDATPGEYVPG